MSELELFGLRSQVAASELWRSLTYRSKAGRCGSNCWLQWRHPLRPGEILLGDNWRVLRGRAAYQGEHWLCGAYLNRENFEGGLHVRRQVRSAQGKSDVQRR